MASRPTTSPSGARLVDVATPTDPTGAVLVLHGGAQRQVPTAVRRTQLSVIRMVPVARAIAGAQRSAGDQVAVHRLLNSMRGWDREHSPTDDVAWALAETRQRHGDVSVVLVGHSLGGRAALIAAAEDGGVAGVVALNPWLYATDDPALQECEVLVVHGDADRIAPLASAQDVVGRLARRAHAELVVVPGGKHAMLSHAKVYERHTLDFVARVLGSDPASRRQS